MHGDDIPHSETKQHKASTTRADIPKTTPDGVDGADLFAPKSLLESGIGPGSQYHIACSRVQVGGRNC
jgi:hypothetical protein